MTENVAHTKMARQARIMELIKHENVRSQADIAHRLAKEGILVSQGTLSKDLLDLGAARVRMPSGDFHYALVAAEPVASTTKAKLARLCADLLLSAQASANLVVLRTPPGAAQFLAAAIDKVGDREILGTIAGDDTALVITRDPEGGQALADRLLKMAHE